MNISDFISQAASKLGADQSSVQSATGGLLKTIKEQADGADFSKITDAIPGIEDAIKSAPAEEAEADGGGLLGGGLGGLASAASSALGGDGGGIMGMLGKTGLPLDKLGGLTSNLFGFIKDKVGGDIVSNILSKIPALKNLVG